MKDDYQKADTNLPEEEIDFSELQGLVCGPEGCAIPEGFYENINKQKNEKNDND